MCSVAILYHYRETSKPQYAIKTWSCWNSSLLDRWHSYSEIFSGLLISLWFQRSTSLAPIGMGNRLLLFNFICFLVSFFLKCIYHQVLEITPFKTPCKQVHEEHALAAFGLIHWKSLPGLGSQQLVRSLVKGLCQSIRSHLSHRLKIK